MNNFQSKEDYLERILILSKEIEKVRAIDIAASFSYSKPSVSIALKKLKDLELINIDDKGAITLTQTGNDIAIKTLDKHETIFKFLHSLGVSKDQALIDACKIEHDLSEESFSAIKKLVK